MNMTTVIRCLSVAAVVVMTGCADSHSDNKEKEESHGHEEHGNEIVIKHEQIEKLGIKTTIVNPSEFQCNKVWWRDSPISIVAICCCG